MLGRHHAGDLLVHVTRVNETRGDCFYDEHEPVEPDTTNGDIFRLARAEYGRCTGRVYVDTEDGARAIGWVFEKRERYTDDGNVYLAATWIVPERVVEPARPTIVEYV
jgi:hypothetical protein